MTLIELLQYLITPLGLGAVATLVTQLIQRYKPEVNGNLAYVVSMIVSAALGIGAFFALPYAEKLPPEVGTVVWPMLVWAYNYLLFRFGPRVPPIE